jgi:hypothetical protein
MNVTINTILQCIDHIKLVLIRAEDNYFEFGINVLDIFRNIESAPVFKRYVYKNKIGSYCRN